MTYIAYHSVQRSCSAFELVVRLPTLVNFV